jgi:hypothetical protein
MLERFLSRHPDELDLASMSSMTASSAARTSEAAPGPAGSKNEDCRSVMCSVRWCGVRIAAVDNLVIGRALGVGRGHAAAGE